MRIRQCNGWGNFETWIVSTGAHVNFEHLMANDPEGDAQEYALSLARGLERDLEDLIPSELQGTLLMLLNSAMDQINWFEIVDYKIQEYKQQLKQAEAAKQALVTANEAQTPPEESEIAVGTEVASTEPPHVLDDLRQN